MIYRTPSWQDTSVAVSNHCREKSSRTETLGSDLGRHTGRPQSTEMCGATIAMHLGDHSPNMASNESQVVLFRWSWALFILSYTEFINEGMQDCSSLRESTTDLLLLPYRRIPPTIPFLSTISCEKTTSSSCRFLSTTGRWEHVRLLRPVSRLVGVILACIL